MWWSKVAVAGGPSDQNSIASRAMDWSGVASLPPSREAVAAAATAAAAAAAAAPPVAPDVAAAASAAWQVFSDGLRAIFSQWTALAFAVEQNWGGGDSVAKLECLHRELLARFGSGKHTDPFDLEEFLYAFLDDSFDLECEDDSLKEVATLMVRIFSECAGGNLAHTQSLLAQAQMRAPAAATEVASPVAVAAEAEPGSAVAAGGGAAAAAAGSALGLAASAAGDAGSAMSVGGGAAPAAAMDDDGWEVAS